MIGITAVHGFSNVSLALQYGWEPSGTEVPDMWLVDTEEETAVLSKDWDGRYYPGFGQHVTSEDARQLAVALRKALADIPDHPVFRTHDGGTDDGRTLIQPPDGANLLEFYSGPWKRVLNELVKHALVS